MLYNSEWKCVCAHGFRLWYHRHASEWYLWLGAGFVCNVPCNFPYTVKTASTPYVDRIIEWLGVKMRIYFAILFARVWPHQRVSTNVSVSVLLPIVTSKSLALFFGRAVLASKTLLWMTKDCLDFVRAFKTNKDIKWSSENVLHIVIDNAGKSN